MTGAGERQRLVRTVIGQLECELLLGGQWLPMGRLEAVPAGERGQRGGAGAQGASAGATRAGGGTADPRVAASQSGSEVEIRITKSKQLAAIAAEVAQCTKCPLGESRLNPVPGEGNSDARVVFVGEAPGQTEDEQGRPFVGRAGQLLTKIISAMGLKREEVYICNILKCRPPGNRDPQATEIVACQGYLHDQLQVIEPEIIVALGAHAARTLLETNTPIGKLRGRFHEYYPGPMAQPIKLLATYHPAYLLRNYSEDNRRRVWQDMQRVLQELGLPVPSR